MNKIIIRQAKESELQLIEEMHAKRLFALGLESKVELKEPKVYVALLDKKLIGFCKFGKKGKTKPEGFILRVEVLKQFRREGIGKTLVGRAHSFFHSRGIDNIHTVADQDAISFFKRTGYKIKTFFGGGGKGVASMSRPLKGRKRNRPR